MKQLTDRDKKYLEEVEKMIREEFKTKSKKKPLEQVAILTNGSYFQQIPVDLSSEDSKDNSLIAFTTSCGLISLLTGADNLRFLFITEANIRKGVGDCIFIRYEVNGGLFSKFVRLDKDSNLIEEDFQKEYDYKEYDHDVYNKDLERFSMNIGLYLANIAKNRE